MANEVISIDTKNVGYSYVIGFNQAISQKSGKEYIMLNLVDVVTNANGVGYNVRQLFSLVDDMNKNLLKDSGLKVGDCILPLVVKIGFQDKLIRIEKVGK